MQLAAHREPLPAYYLPLTEPSGASGASGTSGVVGLLSGEESA